MVILNLGGYYNYNFYFLLFFSIQLFNNIYIYVNFFRFFKSFSDVDRIFQFFLCIGFFGGDYSIFGSLIGNILL